MTVVKYALGILALITVLFAVVGLVVSARTMYVVAETVEQDSALPRFVLDNGTVLHGETFGDPKNPAVIVVHGGPGWDYRGLLPIQALSDAYFVVFYDQRGAGLSPRVDDAALTLAHYRADLDALVDRFGAGRPVALIGHSFGGMLVANYLGHHSDKVAAAVFAEPGPLTEAMAKHPDFRFPFGLEFALHVTGTWIESRFQSSLDGHARDDYFMGKFLAGYEGAKHPLAGYFCGGQASLDGLTHWRLGSAALWTIPKTYPKAGEDQPFSLVDGVAAYENEVLFVAGACDVILGPAIQREQMKYFANARMVVVDGVGHEMFVENPDAVLAPIRAYLSERIARAQP